MFFNAWGYLFNLVEKASVSHGSFHCEGGWGGKVTTGLLLPPRTSTPRSAGLEQCLSLLSGGCIIAINTWGCLPILGRTGPLSLAADFPVWVGGESSNLGCHPFTFPPHRTAGLSLRRVSAFYLGAVLVPSTHGDACQSWGEQGLCLSLQTFQCGWLWR